MAISWNHKGRQVLLALVTVLSVAVVTSAQKVSDTSSNQSIKIKNFGQMDERFYRGAQPKEQDYKALAALGIKTIIDLREDTETYSKSAVEAQGMTYINIPMIAKKYPTPEAIEAFLKTVNDPATGKFYVHCAGGRHRTGAMGAVYRFQFYNWDFEQVYREMKKFDFYTSWGHGAFKDFVKDYAQTHQTKATQN
ncbi:MAG TPA: tyrosine-protein phosphatase [Pyrinomonadaceae bacterium]|nr:tyrosine-protein phosphatase [Pyrinomonadaceae bacterium]